MVPGDATIQAFASYLPAEAEWQEAVLQEEADAQGEESEYDDEEVSEEEEVSDQEEPEAAEANQAAGDASAQESTQAESNAGQEPGGGGASAEEEKKEGEDDDDENMDDEYDSDYDEEGRYIWGAEGEDWEFYYQEDKEAYEAGLSTVPECLNPTALPRAGEAVSVISTTATGAGANNVIGVSLARDGAGYPTP